MCSWWRLSGTLCLTTSTNYMKDCPKHVELTRNNKLTYIVASRWLNSYYITMHEFMKVKVSIIYCNVKGPSSYMRSVVYRNAVMRRISISIT